jgi:hypothetical protein
LYFHEERYLKPSRDPFMEVSQNIAPLDATFLVILFEIFIHTQSLCCDQWGIHKNIFWVCGWISGEVCEIPDVETHNARIEKASIKIDTQKRNDQLVSLELEKSSLESMHPKNKSCILRFLHSMNLRLWIGWAKCKWYQRQG